MIHDLIKQQNVMTNNKKLNRGKRDEGTARQPKRLRFSINPSNPSFRDATRIRESGYNIPADFTTVSIQRAI